MKRLAAAGTFALLAGGAGLLLLASIFYSCRKGDKPHDMGTSSASSSSPHVSQVAPPPQVGAKETALKTPSRIDLDPPPTLFVRRS